mgnify:CR=1 FL=1
MRQSFTHQPRPSRRRVAVMALLGALAVTGAGAAHAAQLQPYTNPAYIAPVPGQNLSPPAPRQNLTPPPPPTTRPSEGDSSTRIQGGSTRRMPLPSPQQGQ